MIKSASLQASGITAILSLALLFNSCSQQQETPKFTAQYIKDQYEGNAGEKEKEKGIKDAMKWMSQLRENPLTGTVDVNDVLRARKQAMQMRNNTASKRQGLNLKWESLGPDNQGGRTRAMLIDKNNSNHLIVGSVTGGLFVSNDGALNWTEHPDNNKFLSTSISSIIQAANGDVYVGTGETFVYTETNGNGHIGGGIYKSTDSGATFNLLPATEPVPNTISNTWSYISRVAADPYDPNKIYAATKTGLMYTTDGGTTWTAVSGISPTDNGKESRDVKVTTDGVVFAEINKKCYRSIDGTTYQLISGTNGFPATNIKRIEFGVTPQDPNYVYAAIANSGDGLRGIYRSIDAGITWTPYSQENSSVFNPLGEQGEYDIAFAVNPNNKNEVVIGGQLELWKGGLDVGWDLVAYWAPESPSNPYYIHADMHFAVYDKNNPNILYVCSDGGVHKSTNANQQFPTFTPRNKNYITTQFYDIASSRGGQVMGGAQDNGTMYINYKGNTVKTGQDVRGGDGGYCAISQLESNILFSEIQFGALSRSLNYGASFGSVWDDYARGLGMGSPGSSQFIAPFDLSEEQVVVIDSIVTRPDTSGIIDTFRSINNIGYLVFGANGRIMFTPDALEVGGIYWFSRTVSGTISAVTPTPEGNFYIGTSTGNLYYLTGLRTATYNRPTNVATGVTVTQIRSGNQWSTITSGRYISSVGVDPKNSAHIVVTFGGYGLAANIAVSNDALAASPVFTNAHGDLPNMPVYAAIIDFYNPNNLIAGTDFGVWSSSDAGISWVQETDGLSNTPVYSVKQNGLYNEDCVVLYVAAYGRGLMRSTTLTTLNNAICNLVSGVESTKPNAVNSISLYPNPVSNQLNIDLGLAKAGNVTLHVVDIMGREVHKQQFGNKSVGQNKLTTNVSHLQTGVYIVAIETAAGVITRQIVVSK